MEAPHGGLVENAKDVGESTIVVCVAIRTYGSGMPSWLWHELFFTWIGIGAFWCVSAAYAVMRIWRNDVQRAPVPVVKESSKPPR